MTFFKYAREFLFLLYLLILIFGFLRRKNLGHAHYYFLFAILLNVLIELHGYFRNPILIQNKVQYIGMIYAVFVLGGTVSLFIAYFKNLALSSLFKKIQTVLLIANILTVATGLIVSGEFRETLKGWPLYTCFTLLIISIVVFLYEMYNSDTILNILTYYPFYVAFGLLFIYAGLFPVMYFRFYIDSDVDKKIVEILLFSVNIIGYCGILVGIFLARKREAPKVDHGIH